LFNWGRKSAKSSCALGLEIHDDGFALAVVDAADAQAPEIRGVHCCALEPSADRLAPLKEALRVLGARGLPTVVTLPPASYSLVQIESPNLPDDELREASRWRVGDLVDFPIEDAVIDVFRLPASRRAGAPQLLYVVVARSAEVERLVGLLTGAGLEIEAIDIAEMALRNLTLHLDRPERPRAYLHLQSASTMIQIADGPQVYLSRRITQGYDADEDDQLLHAQMENLALEVQRSLDYFESQYAFGPVDQLTVIVSSDRIFGAFSDVARLYLTVPVAQFDIATFCQAQGIDPSALGRGVTAVGAAMRGLPWAA